MNTDKLGGLAYKIGYIFAAVVGLCITVAIIGLTIKFLLWIF